MESLTSIVMVVMCAERDIKFFLYSSYMVLQSAWGHLIITQYLENIKKKNSLPCLKRAPPAICFFPMLLMFMDKIVCLKSQHLLRPIRNLATWRGELSLSMEGDERQKYFPVSRFSLPGTWPTRVCDFPSFK